jgi:DNA uptake protein ComE-like DNA-binding protein
MRTSSARLVVGTAFLVVLASGCSLFQHQRHGSTQATKVDLNTATRKQLDDLPGLTKADVDKIIKNRPYGKKHELVDRGVLDEHKFDAIRDAVEVSHSR